MDIIDMLNTSAEAGRDWFNRLDIQISNTYFIVPAIIMAILPLYIWFIELRSQPSSSASSTASIPPPTEIIALYTYPIKSCRGIKLKGAKLLKTGLELDRQWMFVDAEKHEFLTIRQNSKMTLINTAIDAEGQLVISIESEGVEIRIPAHPSQDWLDENTKVVTCKVWSDTIDGYEYDVALTAGFSKFFGQEVRLLRKGPTPRVLHGNADPKILGREEYLGYADMAPVLVASDASINDLNARLRAQDEKEITIERFRPNIIVKGTKPWIEDDWKTLRLIYPQHESNDKEVKWLTLDVTCRCLRCQVPNVDPDTAEKHKKQPWNTLMSFRRIDEGLKFKPVFGMLCVPRHEGVVKVGMKMAITEVTKDHRYIASLH